LAADRRRSVLSSAFAIVSLRKMPTIRFSGLRHRDSGNCSSALRFLRGGYLFYRAKPMIAVYFVLLAAFFCTMTLIDRRSLGASLIFAASALSFFCLAGS
jgi:hypothetical protein